VTITAGTTPIAITIPCDATATAGVLAWWNRRPGRRLRIRRARRARINRRGWA